MLKVRQAAIALTARIPKPSYPRSEWARVRLSELEELFVCQACGTKGADLRPNFR